MPKIKLALYDHPIRAGIEAIRNSKINIKTGWVSSQDLHVELLDLSDAPLTEQETILIFRVLKTVLARHLEFSISIAEVPGHVKGNPEATGDDALSETRLYVKSQGAIEALRQELKKALLAAGFTRIMDAENVEQAMNDAGEWHKIGPFMTVSKLPIDKMSNAHIVATQTLASFLSKFVIKTPVTNIVFDPEFNGPKYLLTLQKRPQSKLQVSSAAKATSNGFPSLSCSDDYQLSRAKSIEITNQLVTAIIEINEEDEEDFDKKISEIISLTQRPEYNPYRQYAPEKLSPLQIAQSLGKNKTVMKLMKIHEAKKGTVDDLPVKQASLSHSEATAGITRAYDLTRLVPLKPEDVLNVEETPPGMDATKSEINELAKKPQTSAPSPTDKH